MDPAILAPDLEPISFDDLPLGGEWTTRRRTISDSEIALFAAVAGDFSPLTIDVSHAGARFAPPVLLVAAAIGLGTMDMPVPSVAEWEWVNWKFPRPVRAGETIYAGWPAPRRGPRSGGTRLAQAARPAFAGACTAGRAAGPGSRRTGRQDYARR